jgi:type VI secretion system protein ImpJ
MSLPLKVLWTEGVTVGPQHIQQLDRYHEARLQRIAATIHPYLWGVLSARWDPDGLKNNSLRAESLSLIFQDGEIYDAPLTDALPVAADLSALPGGEQRFTFYAALPSLKAHGGNLSDPLRTRHDARYALSGGETPDLFGEAVGIDVPRLRKVVRLVSHLESRDGYDSFPVARVRRMASGSFEIDPAFMPPSLTVAADPALRRMLDCLLEKLTAKIAALYERHWQTNRNTVEIHGGGDLSSFWMLNTISTAGASLTHCASHGLHHPENLFDRLMALAGGLLTFSRKYALADLPAYRHDDPGPGFARLDAIIRDLIDIVIASRYFKIALLPDAVNTAYHRALLNDARIERHTMLYLAVSADMPALELVAAVPRLFKLAGPDDIGQRINHALSGIGLVHMAQVPAEVPVRPNTYYFSIEDRGALYENMMKVRELTIFVPGTMFAGLKLELFGIRAPAAEAPA